MHIPVCGACCGRRGVGWGGGGRGARARARADSGTHPDIIFRGGGLWRRARARARSPPSPPTPPPGGRSRRRRPGYALATMSPWSHCILFGGSILLISPTASRCTPARPPQRRRRPRAPGVTGQVRECCAPRRQNAPQTLTVCPTNFVCRELNFGCACRVCHQVMPHTRRVRPSVPSGHDDATLSAPQPAAVVAAAAAGSFANPICID